MWWEMRIYIFTYQFFANRWGFIFWLIKFLANRWGFIFLLISFLPTDEDLYFCLSVSCQPMSIYILTYQFLANRFIFIYLPTDEDLYFDFSIYFNSNDIIWYVLPFRLTTLGVLLLRCLNYLINLKISKEIRANKGWVWGSLLWWLHCLRSTEEHLQPGQSSVSSLHRDAAVQHCASNRCEQIHIDHVEPVLNCCWIQ